MWPPENTTINTASPDQTSERSASARTSFFNPAWLTAPWFWVAAIVLAIGAALAILHFGMIQFGGEDGGIMADIAYMGKLGYRPYTEINTTGFPPAYVLGAGWALRLLGVRWTSLVAFAAIFSALALVAQAWLSVRAGFGRLAAVILAGATQAATMLPLSAWGYNQTTSVLGALYVTAAIGFVLKPKDPVARGALVATAVAMSWGKANVAALLLVLTAVAFLLDRRTRRSGIVLLVCAAALSCLALLVSGADPRDVLASYLVASARVTPYNFVLFIWTNDNWEASRTLALLAPALLVGVASAAWFANRLRKIGATRLALAAVAVAGIVAGIVAMGTNNDHNLVETPVILIGCYVLAWMVAEWDGPRVRLALSLVLAGSMLGLTGSGLISTVNRSRIYSEGPGRYWQKLPLAAVGGPPMMADVQTGPLFRELVADIGEVLRLNPALAGPGATVFFGPRMLVMYPEFGIAPPKGLPTWWGERPDGDPRTTANETLLRGYRYPLMVFLHRDYTFFPKSLVRELYATYDVYDWGQLTIHVLKGATNVTLPAGAVRVSSPVASRPAVPSGTMEPRVAGPST